MHLLWQNYYFFYIFIYFYLPLFSFSHVGRLDSSCPCATREGCGNAKIGIASNFISCFFCFPESKLTGRIMGHYLKSQCLQGSHWNSSKGISGESGVCDLDGHPLRSGKNEGKCLPGFPVFPRALFSSICKSCRLKEVII